MHTDFHNFDLYHEPLTNESMDQTMYRRHCSLKIFSFKNSRDSLHHFKFKLLLPIDFDFEKIWEVMVRFMTCAKYFIVFKESEIGTICSSMLESITVFNGIIGKAPTKHGLCVDHQFGSFAIKRHPSII